MSLLYTDENRSVITTIETPTLNEMYYITVAHGLMFDQPTVPCSSQTTWWCWEIFSIVQMS